ncbi:MAG: glycoside hydrolase family 44 protein [Myxococcaceae bacterium]
MTVGLLPAFPTLAWVGNTASGVRSSLLILVTSALVSGCDGQLIRLAAPPALSGNSPSPEDSSPPVVLDPPVEPDNPGPVDVTFSVRSDTGVRPISPLIYGINGGGQLANTGAGLVRLGGNRWTAWNWETNASNAGSDYQFQNDGFLSSSNTAGQAVATTMDAAFAVGAQVLATVPIVDYLAADKNGGGDVRGSGTDYLTTRFRQNRARKNSALSSSPNATDAFVYQDEFVAWLKTRSQSTGVLFSLDNEPDLWADTHAPIHPSPVGYDELVRRNVEYARAIKSQWPEANICGFVSYGFNGYVNLQDAPDSAGKGEFIDYFLAEVRAAEQADGFRLIEHLDLHWYPEATGGGTRITNPSSAAAVSAARVQAPRSLWDPTYRETSWVANFLGAPIRLIPRMQAKIDANNPGVTLAFTEWNYGGGGHISGAMATADVLGIFGRESVAVAAFWPLNGDESYAYAAFRAFRNFDGAQGAFGDTSIFAESNDNAVGSVYASVDSNNVSRVVVVAVNKSTSPKTAGLTVAHPTQFSRARVFTLAAGSTNISEGPNVTAVATNAFRVTLPAMSVTTLLLVQ